MEKTSTVDEKKIERWKRRRFIIPCLLTTVLTGMYAFGLWEKLNLTTVNVLCIPLFFLELCQGIIGNKNKKKAQLFLAAVFIGTVIGGLNLWTDYQTLGNFHIRGLSSWSILWAMLLTVALLLSTVILIRIVRWSQEQWEELQKQRQKRKLEGKAFWTGYVSEMREHRLIIQQMKREHQKERLIKKAERKKCEWEGKKQRAEIKIKSQMEQGEKVKHRNSESKIISKNKELKISIPYKILVKAITCIVIIGGFILLPYINNNGGFISEWLSYVRKLVEVIKDDSSSMSLQGIVLYYLFFYIFAASIILITIYLVFRIVNPKTDSNSQDGDFKFIATYQEPIAILIVSGAAFYIITNGKLDIKELDQSWKCLLFIILMALVIFTAIEIVRIVLDQCAHSESLLRKVIYLVFLAVLKFLSELLLGVITNLRVQKVVDLVFMVVFPDSDPISITMNNKLKQLFSDEISKVGCENQTTYVSKIFHRHQIWRKHR